MPVPPPISVIVTTYQRPEHLRRSLLSLAMQRGVDGQFEVVVTDDGSTDNTAEVVKDFARSVPVSVKFVTQDHDGFRAARTRNNGVRVSAGSYLVFVDGDCIVPPHHLVQHIRAQRPGVARSGDSYRLDRLTSERIDERAIISGAFQNWVPKKERSRISRRWIKDKLYGALGHRTSPRVLTGNLAVWRSDFVRVNGFDESFIGWGCEDDDLAQRLRRAGVRIASILGYTRAYHLWHAADPSQPTTWSEGANVDYLRRADRPIRCQCGLATPA